MSPNLLIVNPRARQVAADPALPQAMLACLEVHGVACDLHLTREAGEATEVARGAAEGGYERVIVAGGDGTVNEAINGLAGRGAALGVIPLGTGNALGHHFELPPGDIEAACRLIATGTVRESDLGLMNERYFANMAGLGRMRRWRQT